MNEMQDLLKAFTENNSELPTLPAETLENFYASGYHQYENGQYENAMHFFRLLTFADSGNRKHWMGLGAAYQMLEQYDKALQSYGCAAMMDENDPNAHLHAAECFFATNQKKPGKQALRSAKTVALRDPKKYESLLAQIALLQETRVKKRK